MQLELNKTDGVSVVRCVEDRLDALVAVQFKDNFRAMIEQFDGGVVLDMDRVQFMDSSGLGAVVAVFKLVGPEKSFALCNLSPAVDRVLKLTRMDTIFSIFETLDAAVETMGRGATGPDRKAS